MVDQAGDLLVEGTTTCDGMLTVRDTAFIASFSRLGPTSADALARHSLCL
jgi:hypothetical protein